MFIFSKLREVVWGKPAATKAERKLLVKLDLVILSFCCLMYWVNYLDRMNLNNAYVTGMREDLNFHGNQLNIANTGKSGYTGLKIKMVPNFATNVPQFSTVAMFWDRFRTTSPYKSFLRVSISRPAWLLGACSLWALALLTTHGRSWLSDSFKLSLRLLRSLVASIFSEVGTSRTSSAKELRSLLAVV